MSIDSKRILQIAGRMIRWDRLVGLAQRFGYGSVGGAEVDESLGEQADGQPVRLVFPPGYRCVQDLDESETIVLYPRGGGVNAVAIPFDNSTYGPTDLEKNEPVICDKAGSAVLFFADGSRKLWGTSGAVVHVDPVANVALIPAGAGNVRLGTDDPTKLSNVALYQALKTQYDSLISKFNSLIAAYNAHTHSVGMTPTTIPVGPPFTNTGAALTSAVASPNVLAKDRI